MIKTFRFKNFLSFKDEIKFSLERDTNDDSHGDSYSKIQDFELLKSAAIYGANASGKSNFTKAFVFFHNFVVKSLALASLENVPIKEVPIPTVPFLLNTRTVDSPSFFEIEILSKAERFIYGFEASSKKICREWLHQYPNKKILFERMGNEVNSNKRHFKEATLAVEKGIESNILFLTKLALNNSGLAHEIIELTKKINV